jgi:hypothetical protein
MAGLGLALGGCFAAVHAEEIHWHAAAPSPARAPAASCMQASSPVADLGQPIRAVGFLVPADFPVSPIAYSGVTPVRGAEPLPEMPPGCTILPMPTAVPPQPRAATGGGLDPWPHAVGAAPPPPLSYDEPVPFDGGEEFDTGCGFGVGVGLHILRPVISNNAGLIVSTTNGTTTNNNIQNLSYGFAAAPSVWLSYTFANDLTARVTWFHFNESSQTLNASAVPGSGVGVTTPSGFLNEFPSTGGAAHYSATDHVSMDIVDIDLARTFRLGMFELTPGLGIRAMHLDQTYNANRFHSFPAGSSAAFENDGNSFGGAGPTLFLDVERRLGCSNLSLYADTRVGLLFGDRNENSNRQHTYVNTAGAPFTTTSNRSDDSDLLIGFAEVELGVQWARQCACCRPFIRVGFEGRGYFGTGNAQSGAGSTAGPGVPSLGHTGDIGLIGFAIQAGLVF